MPTLNDKSLSIGNDIKRLFVPGTTYTTDLIIDEPDLLINLNDMNQALNTIVIDEGVEMRFTNDTALTARSNLAIKGTANKLVILTSAVDAASSWRGLLLVEEVNVEISQVLSKTLDYAALPIRTVRQTLYRSKTPSLSRKRFSSFEDFYRYH